MKWTKVEDGLPPKDRPVLIRLICNGGQAYSLDISTGEKRSHDLSKYAIPLYEAGYWDVYAEFPEKFTPTHWAYIEEPEEL